MLQVDLEETKFLLVLKKLAATTEDHCKGTKSSYIGFFDPSISTAIIKNIQASPISVISGSSFP